MLLFASRAWIDAAERPNKRGGAYSASTVPSAHPYVFMNYTGRTRDVMTLAHELGHGVHQYLSREQGMLQAHTPLTTAEMASTFGEMLVFTDLMEKESDPQAHAQRRLELAKTSFETALRNMRELAEMAGRANREALEMVNQRALESFEEIRTAMAHERDRGAPKREGGAGRS